MLREKGTLNTKDAPQLPLSLTPRWGGGRLPRSRKWEGAVFLGRHRKCCGG